jgi:acyl-CoA thioester hydrolase
MQRTMPQIYRYELTVTKEAEDQNGHVNNIEYLRWMQDAAVQHSGTSGCTEATNAIGATWVIRSHWIEYLKPAFAGEKVVVLTWVSDFRRVQSLRKYRIIRPADRTLLAEGETDWVFVDAQNGKLRSIPKEIKATFELLPEDKERDILDF